MRITIAWRAIRKGGNLSVWHSIIGGFILCAASALAFAAETYPTRPVRLVVPTGSGGITDILARIVAEKLRGGLGQQIVIDNRAGASGIVGSAIVAKAAPDGYTLLMVFPTHPVNPSLHKDLPYDTVRDFAPVTMVGSVKLVLLVNPSLPAKSVRDLIALARDRTTQLNYGSVGAGSLGYLAGELFASLAGIKITHVPYKGVPQVQSALISGEVQIYFDAPITAIPQVKSGRLNALGVTTKTRIDVLPGVPTIAEAGVPGYEVVGWNGIVAPARTPRAIIERLHREIVKTLLLPDVVAQFAAQGVDAVGNTPEEFGLIIKADIEKWGNVIRRSSMQAN